MAYASTIGGGKFTQSKNIPMNIYIPPEIRKTVWAPVEVPRHLFLMPYVSKRMAELPKPSAMHTREGHTYESRAVVLNNPLHPIEISGWGELNNLGGGGLRATMNAKTPNSKAARKTIINARSDAFEEAIEKMKKEIDADVFAKYRIARPPPWTLGSYQQQPNAQARKVWSAAKKVWDEKDKAWKAMVKKVSEAANMGQFVPIPDDVTKWRTGNERLLLIFKRGGYFVAPKLSTLELRSQPEVFKMGKGQNYIELDGLIYNKKQHRIIILELKKGKGATGFQDAQQMRKAAALFRKWGLEITGRIPTVELYFAAGAAERFETAKNYEYNLEKNNVQNWPARRIEEAIKARPDHIVYLRTPVFLLTGLGLSDLLRIDPLKMAQLTAATTRAYTTIGRAVLPFFEERDRKITDPDMQPFALVRSGGSNTSPVYRRATPVEIDNPKIQLWLDLGKLAQTIPSMRNAIPAPWRPNRANNNTVPQMKLARVAEGIVYINYLKNKIDKGTATANKLAEYKSSIKAQIKLLLSNKYKPFMKANEQTRLRTLLNTMFPGGSPVRQAVSSPVKNQKFYSRILKAAAARQASYYKRQTGERKTKPASEVKVGYTKVDPNRLLPNYAFKKGAPVNLGANITANNVRQMEDEALNRWVEIILSQALSGRPLNKPKLKQYSLILKTALNNRRPLGPNAKASAKEKRKQMIKAIEKTYEVIRGQMNIHRLALSPERAPTRFSPNANAARQTANGNRAGPSRQAANGNGAASVRQTANTGPSPRRSVRRRTPRQ